LASVVTAAIEAKSFLRYAFTTVEDARSALGETMTFHNHTDGPTYAVPVGDDPKGLFGMLMSACTLDDPIDPRVPKSTESEIFVSEEASQVRFLGQNRRADSLLSHFSEIGTPRGTLHQLTPNIAAANAHPLLEVADVAAYLCAHAHDPEIKFDFFPNQLHRMRHQMTSVRLFEGGSKFPPGYPAPLELGQSQ
jgi:hypothetical protein